MANLKTLPGPPHDPALSFSSGANVILGLWLILSPWVVGHTTASLIWNNVVVGFCVLLLAVIRLSVRSPVAVASWANLVFALWLIISPFVMRDIGAGEHWNCVISGILVGVFAITSGAAHPTRHAR